MRERINNEYFLKQTNQPSIFSCQAKQDKLVVQLNDGRENKWIFGEEDIHPKQLTEHKFWGEGKMFAFRNRWSFTSKNFTQDLSLVARILSFFSFFN